MSNKNKDWTADDNNVYEQLPANQLSNLDNNDDVESVVRDIVSNVHTQDMFSNPPPSNSQKKKEKKKKGNNSSNSSSQPCGMLPKFKQNKQKIFEIPNNKSTEDGEDTDGGRIALAILQNAHRPPNPGEGSSSSSALPASTNDSTDNDSTDGDRTTGTHDVDDGNARGVIESFMKQLINPNNTNSATNRNIELILKELGNFYTRQMVYRDKASRNLDNINHAKEKNGRVPVGMQIKVTPEVLGNNDVNFKQAWAQALTEAEGILSSCIEQHLSNYIHKIDVNISTRVNQALDILMETDAKDPIGTIKSTLTKANTERNRINEETRKRKRENKDDGPPNKKIKK